MAEEAIYCPACNQKLRVPEEMLGQVVQCPLCNLVFAAPVRGGGHGEIPPPAVRRVAEADVPPELAATGQGSYPLLRLRVPAIGMLVVAAIGLIVNGFHVLTALAGGIEKMQEAIDETIRLFNAFGLPAQGAAALDAASLYWATLTLHGALLLVHVLVMVGAFNMLRGTHYGLAKACCMLSLLTFLDCPCCLVSLPFGIWGLVLLHRPDVREAFQ